MSPEAPGAPAAEAVWVVEVAVAVPVPQPFSYLLPEALAADTNIGARVLVPVGPRKVPGFVLALERRVPDPAHPLKSIASLLETRPSLTPVTLELGLWVARYYGAAPGEALQAVVPAAVRHGRAGRRFTWITPGSPDLVRELRDANVDKRSWSSRLKVLALLEERPEGLPLADLQSEAGVSLSPVKTLQRLGALQLEERRRSDDPFENLRPTPSPPPELTEDQAAALEILMPAVNGGAAAEFLLHGVTGSGKTEVYLRMLEATLERGRGAILMVPEIALTPQTVERLLARLPAVAVLHSNLSDGDRARQWERLRSGEARVAVGPRSAVFAPIDDVGLIILDEEHETTFKQQQSPRYHARDVARRRVALEQGVLVLGTATPSLETEYLCTTGEATRIRLPRRVGDRPLPRVAVIDMRHEKPTGPGGLFSRPLYHECREALDRGEQVLLFLNRRGFSTTVLCRRCGWKGACPHCAINLTHYRRTDRLLCHYCGHEAEPPTHCPDCDDPGLRYGGFGTERVEEAARLLFPGRRIARMDGETLRRRGAAESLFNDLRDGRIDILVGTQVIAKGLDIPRISVVGVISADTALLVPDFRSAERTFQLLCQVAGRAGRGRFPGSVLVQSYCPDHYSIQCARTHDATGFAERELAERAALAYPPSGHLLRIVVESPRPGEAAAQAAEIGAMLRELEPIASGAVNLLGPAPCPIPVLRGSERSHLLLQTTRSEALDALMEDLPRRGKRDARVLIDRDPVAVM